MPRIVWPLLIAAVIVRVAMLAAIPDALRADPDGYRRLAENVVEQGVFGSGRVPTAYRPPTYPMLLVPCVALDSATRVVIGALHVALGVATVGLTFVLARRAGMGNKPAAIAAALVTLDPILLMQSGRVMSETLAALLAAAAVILLDRCSSQPSLRHALAAGAALGVLALCRPGLLGFVVLAALLLPWFAARSGGRRRLPFDGISVRIVAGLLAGLTFTVGPWIVRNQMVLGRPTPATTHGGYTFLLGNNPFFYKHLQQGDWFRAWQAEPFHVWWRTELSSAGLVLPATQGHRSSSGNSPDSLHLRFRSPEAELQADALAYRHAFATIRARPGRFVWSCAVRAGRFWSPLPFQVAPEEGPRHRTARYAVAVWYGLQMALAAVGLGAMLRTGRRRRSVALWSLLLAVALTGVHTFYWSNLRMRAPLVPLIAVAAVGGAVCLRQRYRPGKDRDR